jgi:hypothetical protein
VPAGWCTCAVRELRILSACLLGQRPDVIGVQPYLVQMRCDAAVGGSMLQQTDIYGLVGEAAFLLCFHVNQLATVR